MKSAALSEIQTSLVNPACPGHNCGAWPVFPTLARPPGSTTGPSAAFTVKARQMTGRWRMPRASSAGASLGVMSNWATKSYGRSSMVAIHCLRAAGERLEQRMGSSPSRPKAESRT